MALDLDDFDGTVGGNISGTSDLAPLDQQAQLLQEMFPDEEKVGLLYCSAEPNSVFQVDTIQLPGGHGLHLHQYAFTDAMTWPL